MTLLIKSVGFNIDLSNPDNLSWNYGPLMKDNVDIILLTKDHKKIGAHKAVLSVGSNFFKNIFEKDRSQNMMYFNFIKSNTLQLVMEFVYKGRCDVVLSNIDLFSAMCEKFELDGISESPDSINSPEGSEQKADIVEVVDKNSIKQTDSSFTREINKLILTMRSVGYDRNLGNPDNLS